MEDRRLLEAHEAPEELRRHTDWSFYGPGYPTHEELVEQLTWAQLGRHKKPILIANIAGYWDPLLKLVEHMRAEEFLPPGLRVDILVANRVEDILPKLREAAHGVTKSDEAMAVPAERL